ncbi:AlbA family DNA-binding domain-containing protein [Nocardiopsis eucommiae]|uniref:AlbA family DNA-binding domain-containing protein n=1 Tax=Nocardiopsis eucommiae TaxID=2831970 RepID=UPI003D7241EA
MDRLLPPTWRPASEAELEAALNEGAFTETPKREAKQQLRGSKDQAKDMASFAIDGGLIVVGVREVKTEGRFELAPVEWVDQILETPARIAASSCDPPLQVSVEWLESERPGHGYLLIEVPASPLAPHMAGGAYYGRGDREKRRLPDTEVERLIRARDTSLDVVRTALREQVEKDPFPEGALAHLHVVALPSRRIPGMFKAWTAAEDARPLLFDLVRDGVSRLTRERAGAAARVSPVFGELVSGFRTAGGVGIASQLSTSSMVVREERDLRLVVRERGEVSLYCGRAADRSDGRYLFFDGALAFRVRAFLDLLASLSEDAGYGGSWDVGVAVTNTHGVSSWDGERASSPGTEYDAERYEQVTRVPQLELEKPGSATDRLVGELLRSLGNASAHTDLLADPE